jgi:hypothetical protein
MGKLSEFIECGAVRMGYPRTVLESHVKPLRKANLITTGGRGTAAPDINAHDCARVILSLMAGSPTYAVEVVSMYGNLQNCLGPHEANLAPFDLPSNHTLIDMIAALFQSAADGTLTDNLTKVFIAEGLFKEEQRNDDGSEMEFDHYSSFSLRLSTEVAFVTLRCVINSYHVDDVVIRYLPKADFLPFEERQKAYAEQPPAPPIKPPGIITYTADAGPDVVQVVGEFLKARK